MSVRISTMKTTVAMILPVEVIYHILCFLGAQDIVRLRTVSKQFRNFTYAPTIWRTLYKNTHVPRPPGPFSSQPVHFLEHALIKSERLARLWTTQPMRYLSIVQVRVQPMPMSCPRIIDGKWLISCESSERFVVYDLDSETVPPFRQVLWVCDRQIYRWDLQSATSIEGPVLCIMVTNIDEDPCKLLKFRVNRDSGHLYHSLSLDVPTNHPTRPYFLNGGHGPFLLIDDEQVLLIFDVESQIFYEFPAFSSSLPVNKLPHSISDPLSYYGITVLTNTHIIYLHSVSCNVVPSSHSTLVQVFTLPPAACPVRSGTNVLRLSHEGIVHDVLLHDVNLIRNSVTNPKTGVTNIRLLMNRQDRHLSCMDLTLPKHSPTGINAVLPITINMHDILKLEDALYGDHNRSLMTNWACCFQCSDDGHARGFWLGYKRHVSRDSAMNDSVVRFTIDASQDKCTGVLGRLTRIHSGQIDCPLMMSYEVDTMRGKFCYTNRDFVPLPKERGEIVVVDFE
ncbi:hypothetical protein JVT61DRAFT_14638 [Boletus reticuloceps]|uniref:F-box domain-containing protein n=1 Tax=Boletus reticuloceps TaxID=495285 RepID=A0A8I2YWF6_9AGAM|nr:hypothetical protein JVT61DRAFT_14638 [Boletus reticuloceps]